MLGSDSFGALLYKNLFKGNFMISGITHVTIFVTNQDTALDFWTEKIGFDLHTDAQFGPLRWLTVNPKGNKYLEFSLILIDKDGQALIDAIARNAPVLCLSTLNCNQTYAKLKAKGVVFIDEPKSEEWGVGCTFVDPFGNRFYLTSEN